MGGMNPAESRSTPLIYPDIDPSGYPPGPDPYGTVPSFPASQRPKSGTAPHAGHLRSLSVRFAALRRSAANTRGGSARPDSRWHRSAAATPWLRIIIAPPHE